MNHSDMTTTPTVSVPVEPTEAMDDLNDLAKEAHDEGYQNGFADAKWDRQQVYDRDVLTEDMDRDCLRDSWYEGPSSDFRSRIATALTARHEAPASAVDDLVDRFAVALKEKLHAAEAKYGHDDAWMRDDWLDDLKSKLRHHVFKGDPRDVAAYCAFAWHHDWSVGFDLDQGLPLSALDPFGDRGAARASLAHQEAPAEGAGERHWIERYADGGGVVLTGYDVNAEDQAEWDEVHLRFIALDGAETYRSYSARSAPEASPQVEAVAWRVKDYGDGWIICHDKDSATNEAALMGGATVQPLYTHPQPAQTPGVGGGGVREAAQALLTACVKDFGDPDDFTGDDGAVASGTDGDCAVTFKHLRDLAAALAALAAGESA